MRETDARGPLEEVAAPPATRRATGHVCRGIGYSRDRVIALQNHVLKGSFNLLIVLGEPVGSL